MTTLQAARRSLEAEARNAAAALVVAALVGLGYFAVADPRISAALAAILALAAWGVFASQQPRLAVSVSFPVVLLAGTKFRTRDPSASLDGVMDAQIVLELALFAMIAVGLVGVWLARPDRRRVHIAEAIVLGYAAIATLSVIWSATPALTLVRATQLLVVAALAIVAGRLLTPWGAFGVACTAVALYVVVCAGLAAVFPWAWDPADWGDPRRFSWFAVHPVTAGTLAAIGALGVVSATAFGSPHYSPRIRVALLLCCATALFLVLIATNSRGPLLALIAGLCVLAWMRMRTETRIPLLLVAASVAVTYFVWGADVRAWMDSLANQDSAIARLLLRGQTADAVLTFSGRLELWQDLRPAMAAHPLLGYGYQASRAAVLDVAYWAAYAHNALLQTMLDLGIVGALALGAIVVAAFRGLASRGVPPSRRAALAAMTVFLLLNSISTESFAAAPGFETLLLFLCALGAGPGHPVQAAA